jgi:hypothetical protein
MPRNATKEIADLTAPVLPQVPRISPDDGFVTVPKRTTTTGTPAPNPDEEFMRNATHVGDSPYTRPSPYSKEQQTGEK